MMRSFPGSLPSIAILDIETAQKRDDAVKAAEKGQSGKGMPDDDGSIPTKDPFILTLSLPEAILLYRRIGEENSSLQSLRRRLRDYLYAQLTIEELEDSFGCH